VTSRPGPGQLFEQTFLEELPPQGTAGDRIASPVAGEPEPAAAKVLGHDLKAAGLGNATQQKEAGLWPDHGEWLEDRHKRPPHPQAHLGRDVPDPGQHPFGIGLIGPRPTPKQHMARRSPAPRGRVASTEGRGAARAAGAGGPNNTPRRRWRRLAGESAWVRAATVPEHKQPGLVSSPTRDQAICSALRHRQIDQETEEPRCGNTVRGSIRNRQHRGVAGGEAPPGRHFVLVLPRAPWRVKLVRILPRPDQPLRGLEWLGSVLFV